MSAPTEEEIRAAIAREWGKRSPNLPSIEVRFSDVFTTCANLKDSLYDLDDLRESEIDRLDELVVDAIRPIRDDARRRINEAVVAATLQFGREHPDAPRATREAAAAA
jgi:hypothetical protein